MFTALIPAATTDRDSCSSPTVVSRASPASERAPTNNASITHRHNVLRIPTSTRMRVPHAEKRMGLTSSASTASAPKSTFRARTQLIGFVDPAPWGRLHP